MLENQFSDRLKMIDVFFKRVNLLVKFFDLNFLEGRFDWSVFHWFGFFVDRAPSRLFAGTRGRNTDPRLDACTFNAWRRTRGGVVYLYFPTGSFLVGLQPQATVLLGFVFWAIQFYVVYILNLMLDLLRLAAPLFRPFVIYCVGFCLSH